LSKKERNFLLWTINLWVILFWYWSFDGFYFYDDITYAKEAANLLGGTFSVSEDHFTHRWFVIFLTAGVLKIFGVSHYAVVLTPLLFTLITVNLVFLTLAKSNLNIAILAAALTSLDFYTVFFSNKLYPDPLITGLAFIVMAILFRLYTGSLRREKWGAFFLSLCLFLTLATKLVGLYLLPMVFFWFSFDLVKKRNYNFWGYACLSGLLLLSLYLTWYYWALGEFLYRFRVVADAHYLTGETFYDKSVWDILKRISYGPFSI